MDHSAGAGSPSRADPDKQAGGVRAQRERAPRRNVALNGFAMMGDGTDFGFSAVDLSYDGCKIEPQIALFPGVRLKLSLLGFRGQVDAQVCWHNDGRSGLKFTTDQMPARVQTARHCERSPVTASLGLRRVGRKQYMTEIFDIGPSGCKVEFIEKARPGELVWVKFQGLDSVEAIVRWAEGFYGGLQFVQPIHSAIFDSLREKLES